MPHGHPFPGCPVHAGSNSRLPSRSAIGLGLPVRTVIERGHPGQAPERQSVRTGVEGSQDPRARGDPRSPCANRVRRMARSPERTALRASLCEQGSKGLRRISVFMAGGLPVRTGVEGHVTRPAIAGRRSPCANRGRRKPRAPCKSRPPVSLCEQGSKDQSASGVIGRVGLPVPTGVEVTRFACWLATFWSPCANRGRRPICEAQPSRAAVPLCEQGSKGGGVDAADEPFGLPVRTGVEG